jgi:hypothetical protein
MCHLSIKTKNLNDQEAFQFIQTYSLKNGLKMFGVRGKTAATSEMCKLHEQQAVAI